MQRFFFDIPLWEKNLFIEDKNFFHQISHVLRSLISDELALFNWDGHDYFYKISEISKKWVKLELSYKNINTKDPKIKINLYQALPNKYEKIEYIIQKWTEIWINSFIFFPSERSQKLVINDKKIERFRFIIQEALEQCWWCHFPEIGFVSKLNISKVEWDKLVCHTKLKIENWKLKNEKLNIDWENAINIFVWPEWGFSEQEIKDMLDNWTNIINFWERILRTETVWIALGFYILQN